MLQRPITTRAAARRSAPARPPARATPTSNVTSSGARRRTTTTRTPTPTRAAAAQPAAAAAAAQTKTKTRLALKEWAVTIDALLAGDQVLLLRKGGLLDGKFRLEARDFLLFPTTFHVDDPSLLTPGAAEKFASALALPEPKTLEGAVPLKCRARVEAAWSTADGRVVEALAGPPPGGLHVWGGGFTAARLKWRPGAPMTLALVRAYARAGAGEPLLVKQKSDYYGCFSWAQVEPMEEEGGEEGGGGDDGARWRPVLSDDAFARRAAAVREGLVAAGIEATPIEL